MNIEELLNQSGPQEEVEEGAPMWMATFADMSTLLLTFFVLLLSFANMDAQKFREMLGSVKDAFGVQKQTPGDYMQRSSNPLDFSILEQEQKSEGEGAASSRGEGSLSMDQAMSVMQAMFEDLGEGVEVVMGEEGVTVRVDGKLLFPSGAAEVRPEGLPVLDRVATLMHKYTFDLYIVGHTDSVPIQTPQFPSNWELSAARATASLRYLLQRGAEGERLVAVGFADSRPLADNTTPEGRARNRRVEFLFKNPDTMPEGGFKPARL